MAFFSKQEIMDRMIAHKETVPSARADMNLALIILGSALFDQKLRSGRDYGEHPIHVGFSNTRSNTKRIIGILHDVLEDSDWTVDDLRAVGFSERIVLAVDAMTHRENEKYFDSIERCSLNKDALDKKIEDLSHNLDNSRNEMFVTEKDMERSNKYTVSRAYLLSIKKGITTPGTPVTVFVKHRPDFRQNPMTEKLLEKYSGHYKAPAPAKPAIKSSFKRAG